MSNAVSWTARVLGKWTLFVDGEEMGRWDRLRDAEAALRLFEEAGTGKARIRFVPEAVK